jgi:hypothetical protein
VPYAATSSHYDAIAVISDGVSLVIVNGFAVTCMVRGEVNPRVKARRADRKRKRRASRRVMANDQKHGKLEGRKRARMIAEGAQGG